jgi:hypothetical protein
MVKVGERTSLGITGSEDTGGGFATMVQPDKKTVKITKQRTFGLNILIFIEYLNERSSLLGLSSLKSTLHSHRNPCAHPGKHVVIACLACRVIGKSSGAAGVVLDKIHEHVREIFARGISPHGI